MADADPVTTGLYRNRFSFKYVEKEDIPRTLIHLSDCLFPVFRLFGYDRATMELDWINCFREMLEASCGLSFLAIENSTGKIAGTRVIIMKKRPETLDPPPSTHPHNKDMFEYMMKLINKNNVWDKYPEVQEFAELFGLSVDPEFRQLGIAQEVYRRSLAMLRFRGIKIGRCGFVSPWSRKAGKKHGIKIYAQEKASEAKTPDGRLLNPNANPDDIMDYGIFELF